MTVTLLQDLLAHMKWADAKVWRALMTQPAAAGDEQAIKTLFHMHGTQRAFLDVWQGAEPGVRKRDEFESPEDIHEWAGTFYPAAAEYLAGLSDEDLGSELRVPWVTYFEKRIGRPSESTTLGETVYQVCAHGMHHRGQVTRRLRELDVKPPLVDYIAWLWVGREKSEWTL